MADDNISRQQRNNTFVKQVHTPETRCSLVCLGVGACVCVCVVVAVPRCSCAITAGVFSREEGATLFVPSAELLMCQDSCACWNSSRLSGH